MIEKQYCGRIEEYSCSAMVSASVEEAGEAVASWGRDLGWLRGQDVGQALVFNVMRFSQYFGNLEMTAFAEEQDAGTWVNFTGAQSITLPGQVEDLHRATHRFARGVCSALRESGATVDASWLGTDTSAKTRRWLRTLEFCRRWAFRVWLLMLVPAPVLAVYLPEFPSGVNRQPFVWMAVCWMLLGPVFFVYLRYRVVGYRARFLLFVTVFTAMFLAVLSYIGVDYVMSKSG